jgi:crotonobetainyl-CoA:carnitine CoA-transferase CaiB-like acyl-CoA transferase
VLRLVGHPEVVTEPWFADHAGRVEHQKVLDEYIGTWIAARSSDEVIAAFEAEHAVIGPIYSIEDILKDPQFLARETVTTVNDPRLGPTRIQNAIPRMVDTPGRVRHLGGEMGQDTREILGGELGRSDEELERLRKAGIIGGPSLVAEPA